MTAEVTGHKDLPRTDDLPALPYRFAVPLRKVAAPYFRRKYDLTIHHEDRFPLTGPLLMAPNHLSLLDAPLLGALAPRMLHQLGKIEVFGGLQGRFLHLIGQIPVDRSSYDTLAVRKSIQVLRDGLNSSPGITLIGQTVYVVEGKIQYLFNPELRGKDPGPFKAIAIPLPR